MSYESFFHCDEYAGYLDKITKMIDKQMRLLVQCDSLEKVPFLQGQIFSLEWVSRILPEILREDEKNRRDPSGIDSQNAEGSSYED